MRRFILAGLLACILSLPALASEQMAEPPVAGFDWQSALTKAVAFEVASTALETGLFLGFYGGATTTAVSVFAVTFATATALYLAHEYLWEAGLPAEGGAGAGRIAAKTVTYRLAGTLRSFAVGRLLGGAELAKSAAFALTVTALDSALYAATELGFDRLRPWLTTEAPAAQ